MDNPSSNDSANWRDRYLQVVDDLQRHKRKGRDAEELFTNVVSRVATSVVGFDDGLDDRLRKIQALLKGGSLADDDRRRELDRISAEMFLAALHKSDRPDQLPLDSPAPASSESTLFAALKVLMHSKEELAALEALRERLGQGGHGDESVYLGQIRSGLQGILNDKPSVPRSGNGVRNGLFKRLLHTIRSDHEKVDLAAVKLNLLTLLQAVEMPIAGSAQVDRLRDHLQAEGGTESLVALFQEFADLLVHLKTTIQSDHKRIEEFLADLNETLADLEERAVGVQGLTHEYECGSESFRSIVSGQMETLVCITDAASDLQALKKILRAKVEVMTRYLNTAAEVQNSAVRRTTVLVDQMAGRIRQVDVDVAELRIRLRTQHVAAYRDVLTGLPNRLAYEERIGQEVERWKRFNVPVCLLLWDIDRFKSINDRFGHKSGDNALIVIAEQLAAKVRETDFVGRYGEDEFVMILAGSDGANASEVCEKVRIEVERCPFHTSGGEPVQITLSCGIAQLSDGDTADLLFDRADRALYLAKQEGRNRCKSSGSGNSAPDSAMTAD